MAKKTRGARSKQKLLRTKNPEWVQMPKEDIENLVFQLHSDGLSSAMIGTKLRDQHGIPSVTLATGKGIVQILKEKDAKMELPEDLESLLKRAGDLKKHLRDNPKDVHNMRGLQLMEARIRRLLKYYQKRGTIPKTWKYSSKMVELEMR
jgi:small subunit ribosomal protein S15